VPFESKQIYIEKSRFFFKMSHTSFSRSTAELIKMFYRIKLGSRTDAFRTLWGRFINTHGFAGRNIPNDLHMEHLNGYLKELLRSLRGNLNEEKRHPCLKSFK